MLRALFTREYRRRRFIAETVNLAISGFVRFRTNRIDFRDGERNRLFRVGRLAFSDSIVGKRALPVFSKPGDGFDARC
ncbi:MAG TPA: hypothetical protein VNR51_12785, partial [Hyphomicrobium sp.]|nr:hypothetical protein [Hyphomicrobium sp.]